MAYLGRGLDKISNIEVLDNITFDGSSSYSITKGSVAFTPNSAQSCLISIDGVVQATNFTVSSSTIDFGVAIPSTSVCNFFLHYGTGVMTVPSDGSVTTAKLGDGAVDLTSKVTGALPVANGGTNLTSGFANGITMVDQFRLSASLSNVGNGDITANFERPDNASFNRIGTGMTESSGVFTFPQTGLYLVSWCFVLYTGTDAAVNFYTKVSSDSGSSYDNVARGITGEEGGNAYNMGTTFAYVNVTNASTFRVKFYMDSTTSNAGLSGNTAYNVTHWTFVRLGDSQ
jgi:hypothetical protein